MAEKTLTFEMITPERVVLSRPADFVVLPAYEGEMGVLPGHEPFIVQLQPGELRVTAGEEVVGYSISGGFAEVLGRKVSVFAETAEMASEIDVERARQGLERAKAALRVRTGGALSLDQAEAMIRREAVRLRVAELKRGRGGKGRGPREGR
ncbi:MAG: F0F1 ATP synthase subunit epsilon [Elusimicrobia bacterium]|nr:F0F1 ATP synthase subunit epsilon [Elusimicrobiota bacterium]